MKLNRRQTLALAASVVAIGTVGFGVALQTGDDGQPDFSLSGATVSTAWNAVAVGLLTPVNAPVGSYFVLVESAAASGDETGLAVVNG